MSNKEVKSTNLEAIHKEATDRFSEIMDAEKDQRKLAVDDALFVDAEDGQWEADIAKKRADRPRYTLDRTSGALDQVNGDQRQNRTQIKVRASTGGDDDIAKIQTGLIRSIENNSDATSIYDNGFDEEIKGGYGGWRILTAFNDDDVFEQDIVMAPIRSAASSLFLDPNAKRFDRSDGMFGFLTEDMQTKRFEKDFPDASITDFSTDLYTTGSCALWFRQNVIKLAEYWRVKLVDTEIGLLSDGRVIDLREEKAVLDELVAKGVTVLKTRQTQKRKIESYIMNGAEILKGPMPWAGKYIPLIAVYGRTSNVQGKEFVRGMVRKAKDPQRIYNYAKSNEIETTALTPKDPYFVTPAQIMGHESAYENFNQLNQPFLPFNNDPTNPGPPKRGGAPQVQQALILQSQSAREDIYATTGIQPPSLGLNPEMQSGKAVIAQQKMGDRGTFIFTDNLQKAIKYTGDILIDLIPRIYDTQRMVRVLNFDGTGEDVQINAKSFSEINEPITDDQTGEQIIVNDLSQGKYETVVETGPAYSTLREESAQQLIDLATGSPVFEQVALDLIAKNLPILESEELTERVRAMMIKNGVVQPTEKETEELGLNQPQQPSEEQLALLENLRMQTAQMMADIQNKNADTDNKDAKTLQTKLQAQKVAVDAYNSLIDAYKTQVEAGIPLQIDENQLRKQQQAIIDLSQEELVVNNISLDNAGQV